MGNFIFRGEKRGKLFCFGKESSRRPGCSKSPKKPARKQHWDQRTAESPWCNLYLVHPSNFLSFLLPSLAASFSVSRGCISKSTIKSPLCLCGRWQMHGGHLVLPRQAGHLLWLMLSCRKKWAGKELQWRACRLEGDILISPALSSLLAFGDEMPSGGKCRGYWCKTARNALCQVAVYSFC